MTKKSERPSDTEQTSNAAPMTYTSTTMPNLANQRAAAAAQAESMTVKELEQVAQDLQIDTAGVSGKQALVDAVQSAARGDSTTTAGE